MPDDASTCAPELQPWSFAIEWSADCNNDSIVDYGQILNGQFADIDANGVPDICESYAVPGEYATIQAAIDAAGNGCVIRVAPGTYAPFDVGDKRLVVESTGGPFVTTIDAAGQATSAVRFGPNSTFESVLRGFTIRTGSGTVLPTGTWRAGGGVYLWSSLADHGGAAVTIEDCHFVGSSGGCGYGAGIWAREASVAVRRCRFTGLSAEHHGPAISLDPVPTRSVPGEAGLHALVEDCFIGTSSSYNNGGMLCGLNAASAPTNVRIARCEFVGNSAYYQAGALLVGAASTSAGGELVVENCVFRNNSAYSANAIGIALLGGTPNFSLTLRDSVVADPAVAVRLGTGQLSLDGNTFCAGTPAVVGAYADLGGNAWSCPREADCDGDGVVDLYATTLGAVPDQNDNLVPDSCESIRHVPAQFPTIQAAIDAVPAGEYGLVAVAAGVYNESFSLNGKNVLVRGAAGGATILDGTGIATSVARFTGGEPATAGLESLVFRDATSGVPPLPGSSVLVGGAVIGNGSSASIRGCRFEDCASEFGGAVYLFECTASLEGCVFDGNSARVDGGGALFFRCAGTVSGCSFAGNRAGLKGPGSGSALKTVGGLAAGATLAVSDCTFSGNLANSSGSAIEHYEDLEGVAGVLRLSDCTVAGNTSGLASPTGAGGLRVLGRQSSCVLTGGTTVCGNEARNVSGPYLIEGSASVCDCEADFLGDGFVTGADLGILLGAWGLANAQGTGDLNHDGLVTGADLAILLGSWGACP
ncbi:MAG: right-handed parallel beta-helix repeat-containing protein [Planctomycetota bacterium]